MAFPGSTETGAKEVALQESSKKDVEEFWAKKEQEIGEKIRGKDMSEYLGGYPDLKERIWGLLYYTDSSLYFQTFPRKNWFTSLLGGGQSEYAGQTYHFKVPWDMVSGIILPPQKNALLAFFSPPDYRVFVHYRMGEREETLVFMMYSRENRDRFIKWYKQVASKKEKRF